MILLPIVSKKITGKVISRQIELRCWARESYTVLYIHHRKLKRYVCKPKRATNMYERAESDKPDQWKLRHESSNQCSAWGSRSILSVPIYSIGWGSYCFILSTQKRVSWKEGKFNGLPCDSQELNLGPSARIMLGCIQTYLGWPGMASRLRFQPSHMQVWFCVAVRVRM